MSLFIQKLRNPVLMNEWKVRMRTNKTAWITFLYLAVLGGIVITFIYLLVDGNRRFDPNASKEIFIFLSCLQFAMIGLFIPGLAAGAISGERERQTLSILLTTNLSPTKLILGKWLSSISFMMYLVFASIPLYGLVYLYGGISPAQLLQVFGLYIVTMLGIGSVAILCSTIFKRSGVSIVVTYALLFAYTAGTFLVSIVSQEIIQQSRAYRNLPDPVWPEWLLSLNPVAAMLHVFDLGIFHRYQSARDTQLLPFWMIDPYWFYFWFFVIVTVGALLWSIYMIQPVRKRRGAE